MKKWIAAALIAVTVAFIWTNFVYASADVLRSRPPALVTQRQINPVSRAVALALLFLAGKAGPHAWRQ